MSGAAYLDQAKTFAQHDFGLDRRLIKACAKAGFIYPTLVQSKCIPLALKGKDLLVRARTGSGKTAAFGLPLLQKLLARREAEPDLAAAVRAVVLVPTRELCEQVRGQLWELMAYCRDIVGLLALVDDNMSAQQAQLRDKPDIVVATPARLVAHLKAGNITLKDAVETLVVDEADLVLSYGYRDDIRHVTAHLPKVCQGFLMSATLSEELEELKRVILHSPAILKLEEGDASGGGEGGALLQFFLALREPADKNLVVFAFLKLGLLEGKGLFFVNATDACYRLKLFLEQFHIRSAVLNAELPLASRLHILEEFNRGIFDYLIATDESMDVGSGGAGDSDSESDSDEEEEDEADAQEEEEEQQRKRKRGRKRPRAGGPKGDAEYGVARGIDFRGVKFVMNVDFPPSARSYTHRVGRTARGGASGTALSLLCERAPAEVAALAEVQASQPALPLTEADTLLGAIGTATADDGVSAQLSRAQPAPLAFDLREIEQFRYRVTDVAKKVTRVMVREARAAELRRELINSHALDAHFKSHPDDLRVLRHDKTALNPALRLDHLKHIPSYLMPAGLATGEDPTERQAKRKKRRGKWEGGGGGGAGGSDPSRRKDNDPLQNFGGRGGGGSSSAPRVMQSSEFTGKGMAGRRRWQEKHKKGKFASTRKGGRGGGGGREEKGGRGRGKRGPSTFDVGF
ncbi:DEAD box helicase [Tribonema minus]|uniref:RNA helicase n=1 Tax=Tribonema minus TaxID=303371 RepID=A0A835ZDE1_9STRA|nr:DEAD box helicase [Tribonema minus]